MSYRRVISAVLFPATLLLFAGCTKTAWVGPKELRPEDAGKLKGVVTPDPEEGHLTSSMGLPRTWKPHIGTALAWDRRAPDQKLAAELNFGVYRDLMNPLVGVFGVVGEGYARAGQDRLDGGLRLLGSSRFFLLQGGVDYSFHHQDLNFLMSLSILLRRGGPLRRGGNLRIDWVPAANHSLHFGLSIPVGQPRMGKTRPYHDYVRLPKASAPDATRFEPSPELREALDGVQHAAYWINRFTTPFLDQSTKKGESDIARFKKDIDTLKDHIHVTDESHPDGHTFVAEVETYHRQLQTAIWWALGGAGDPGTDQVAADLTDAIRAILLDEVILPYNRLLGQRKKNDSVRGFARQAEQVLAYWMTDTARIPPKHREAVMYVFRAVLGHIDENRGRSRSVWKDSRLVWIPMHYALQFADHDTEDELDAILEKAVKQEFIEANDVHYMINELFQPELLRTIRDTRDYHVLWIHDISGNNAAGEPDTISLQLVVNGYLKALEERVQAYDSTGVLPVYMIFLDQNYFELNNSKLWLKLLENPLDHEIQLPAELRDWEDRMRSAQDKLRVAVAASPALQSRQQRFGKAWLKNRVKVHVNITNPSDLSFRTTRVLKFIPLTPDNLMRDHRKIAFYDVTELDPGSGEAMYSGMGVGEHYVGPTWDDRSILAQGPAILTLKDAARELLLSQGFAESEIPLPLRPLEKPDNYENMLDELRAKGWTASAMQVQNATGFGPKYANVVKAILYNLMPNGSHFYIPDSLWNGPFWGSMLIGAALRGCVVLVVSPALENAPSAGSPQMSRANELFTRFLLVQTQMKEEINSAGGLFRTGIYSMDLDVADIAGKVRSLSEGVAQSEVFRKVFPFAPSVLEMAAKVPQDLESQGFEARHLAPDELPRKPMLHFKAQFFASEQVIKHVIPLPGWEDLIHNYISARLDQVDHRETGFDAKDLRSELKRDIAGLIASWSQGLSEQEQAEAIVYLTLGSHNQDYRSMIMDGEALFVVGRTWAMVAYLDFVSLMGQTTWVENVEQLEELLPRQTGFWKWLGRYIKLAL